MDENDASTCINQQEIVIPDKNIRSSAAVGRSSKKKR